MKKHKKHFRRIRNIVLTIILALLIFFGLVYYITSRSDNYQRKLIKDVKNNYKISEDIILINKFDNNYIIITDENVIVLNKKYEELTKESLSNLATNPNQYKLIYKNNKLMYEETILKQNKVTYKYYDAYNYELIDKIVLEG